MNVTVNEILGKEIKTIKQFESFARLADVEYNITSVKKNGFSFWRYMDEWDQDGVEITHNGKKSTHRLHCEDKE